MNPFLILHAILMEAIITVLMEAIKIIPVATPEHNIVEPWLSCTQPWEARAQYGSPILCQNGLFVVFCAPGCCMPARRAADETCLLSSFVSLEA